MFTPVYSVANHITAPLSATGGPNTVILWSQCTLSVLRLRCRLPSRALALLASIIVPSYNKRSLSLSYIYCLGRRRRIPPVVANAAASQRSEFGINSIGDSRCRLAAAAPAAPAAAAAQAAAQKSSTRRRLRGVSRVLVRVPNRLEAAAGHFPDSLDSLWGPGSF